MANTAVIITRKIIIKIIIRKVRIKVAERKLTHRVAFVEDLSFDIRHTVMC